jgi:hypothetical protein
MNISEKAKKQLFLALLVVLMIAAAIGTYEYKRLTNTTPMEFDPEVWAHNIELRHRMLDSLTEQYELIGMQKSEIISLLGDNGNGYALRRYLLSDRVQILFFAYDENNYVTSYHAEHWG